VFKSLLGLILGRLVPCLGYYSSDSSFFFTFEGGVHTIEKGTRHFGVQQFGSYLTLCFLQFFATGFFFLILLVQGIKLILLFKIDFFYYSTKIFLNLLTLLALKLFKFEFVFKIPLPVFLLISCKRKYQGLFDACELSGSCENTLAYY
jgi:hypothetical protein